MRNPLIGLLGAGLAVLLVVQGCRGSEPLPVPPRPDGGAWVECDAQDAGACPPGERCRYVEAYERSLCVRPCEPEVGCEDPALLCCGGGDEDGGPGGYCLPREACEYPDAGTDAGTDAGFPFDAGTGTDAGSPVDGGSGTDAGFPFDGGTGSDAGTDAGTPDAGFTRIRIMASNLTSGNNQSYDLGHGTRLMQGVKPDIVLIQEFDYLESTPGDDIPSYVATNFGPTFHYYRESESTDNIPNGVISRWPIIAAGEWKDNNVGDRDYVWARIDIPGPKDLWVVSVHLWSGGGATGRNKQAIELRDYIQLNVPAGDYLVIGGDYNTDNRSESCLSTLGAVVTTSGPHPADQNGNVNTNASRAKPYDQVLVDGDLRQFQMATVIGSSTYANGLVLDSRVYTPLSEVAPVQSGDSSATNMQHMGVVKDFLVPAN